MGAKDGAESFVSMCLMNYGFGMWLSHQSRSIEGRKETYGRNIHTLFVYSMMT